MKFALKIVFLTAAAVATLAALRRWTYEPYRCEAELTLITGSTRASNDLPGLYAREQRATRNLKLLDDLRTRCDPDVRIPFLIGENESNAGHHERALRAYEEALKIDRRPEIYLAIGGELIQLGRMDAAIENYLTAMRFGAYVDEQIPSEEVLRRVRMRFGGR